MIKNPMDRAPKECRECGSGDISWFCEASNRGGVQDGLIKMNEVGVTFYLGCNYCSETLFMVDGNDVAEAMNARPVTAEEFDN